MSKTAPTKSSLRCWDTSAFIAFLEKEKERIKQCRQVIRAAEEGKTIIYASTFAITEVCRPRGAGGRKFADAAADLDAFFFSNPFIRVVAVDRRVAVEARTLCWDHGMKPPDAVHIATALIHRVPVLETFDKGMLNLAGKLKDSVEIRQPTAETPQLDFD